MRRASIALLLAGIAGYAFAQPAPFDMTPERGPVPPAEDAPQPTPSLPEPQRAPDPDPRQTEPEQSEDDGPEAEEEEVEADGPHVRPIIPLADFVLSGETAARSWTIHLTEAQIRDARINLAYQSAIVTAPEASRLTLSINDTAVLETPVASANSVSELEADIPAGLLKAGRNLVSLRADQRHRTDCTIESTYELWADIDPARTTIAFASPDAGKLVSIEDIASIGVDTSGRTRVAIVAPGLPDVAAGEQLLRLAEGISLTANMPNLSFSVSEQIDEGFSNASLKVITGTAEELQDLGLELPAQIAAAPTAAFVQDDEHGSVLVVAAPTRPAIDAAVGAIVRRVDRPANVQRTSLVTEPWRAPDAPMLVSGASLRFADLGIATSQFSGRRFSTGFQVAIPSDFYADAYGEARILLDAAYSGAVRPGSRIDIYVNGNIASTAPITSRGGGIYRQAPINVTMRHFRPGVNDIRLEAVLLTAEDEACAPGATASTAPRFALFDSSRFVMPAFARIGQRPNLAAVSGTGFPYNRAEAAVPIVMETGSPELYSAAATIVGKMSLAAGRPIPLALATPQTVGENDAIFIGAISQIPPGALAQVGIAENNRTAWTGGGVRPNATPNTEDAIQQWRESLSGNPIRNRLTAFEAWMQESFDISIGALRLAPRRDGEFSPNENATFVIAQGANPANTGTWTVITAPTTELLQSAADEIARQSQWNEIRGHLAYFEQQTARVAALPVNVVTLVPSQPFSLGNIRLIASNWLSTNILSYSALLAILCIGLGLATAGLLSRLGRKR
jgi:cellulose synthase operon protein B